MPESAAAREKRLASQQEQRRYNFIRIWQKRYARMVARHEGRSTNSSGAAGQGICTADEFFVWCKQIENLDAFIAIYYDWFNADFALSYVPSVDRIDPTKGYTCDNLQWLSFEENCRKNNINPIDHSQGGW